jgi:hypothetical protein
MHHWVVLAARWYCAAAALMRGHRADLWRYAQAMGRAVVLLVLLCHLRAVLPAMLLADRLAMRRSRAAHHRAAVQAMCRLLRQEPWVCTADRAVLLIHWAGIWPYAEVLLCLVRAVLFVLLVVLANRPMAAQYA